MVFNVDVARMKTTPKAINHDRPEVRLAALHIPDPTRPQERTIVFPLVDSETEAQARAKSHGAELVAAHFGEERARTMEISWTRHMETLPLILEGDTEEPIPGTALEYAIEVVLDRGDGHLEEYELCDSDDDGHDHTQPYTGT